MAINVKSISFGLSHFLNRCRLLTTYGAKPIRCLMLCALGMCVITEIWIPSRYSLAIVQVAYYHGGQNAVREHCHLSKYKMDKDAHPARSRNKMLLDKHSSRKTIAPKPSEMRLGNSSAYVIHKPASSNMSQVLESYNCVSGKNPHCHNASVPPVLQPIHLCTSLHLDLLIMIDSAPNNARQRALVRNTWLQTNDRYKMRHFFVLGLPVEPQVYKEAKTYNDILVGNFYDTYRNLTWKTVFGYWWWTEQCSNIKYFMKTDDDMYVNVVSILDSIYKMPQDKPMMVGKCYKERKVPRWPEDHRWHVSYEMYPGPRYPPHCCGCGYVITGTTARDVASVLQQLPFLVLEDTLTGVAVAKLNYTVDIVASNFRFNIMNLENEGDICTNVKSGQALTLHKVKSDFMQRLHTSCRYDPKTNVTGL